LPFVLFLQKKSTADAHRIICEKYDENVIVIRTCANWFKQFKNRRFNIDINDKERSGRACSYERGRITKRCEKVKNGKYLEIYYIDFFIVIKNRQKFCDLILRMYVYMRYKCVYNKNISFFITS